MTLWGLCYLGVTGEMDLGCILCPLFGDSGRGVSGRGEGWDRVSTILKLYAGTGQDTLR